MRHFVSRSSTTRNSCITTNGLSPCRLSLNRQLRTPRSRRYSGTGSSSTSQCGVYTASRCVWVGVTTTLRAPGIGQCDGQTFCTTTRKAAGTRSHGRMCVPRTTSTSGHYVRGFSGKARMRHRTGRASGGHTQTTPNSGSRSLPVH